MSDHGLRALLRRLGRTHADAPDPVPDGQLLRRVVAENDQAAFELLIWRHGAMVLGVCRRLLRDEQLAEDAFQATFLVLARKARSVRGERLGGWLHRVALRVASEARRAILKRTRIERPLETEPAAPDGNGSELDLRPVLDAEVNRLPERYRLPVVLCYLGGLTTEEAARRLGCPRGTVLSRLATARQRLAARLTRRGVGLSAGGLAAGLGEVAAASVPAALVIGCLQAAMGGAGGGAALAGSASSQAAAWAKGVIQAMFLTKLKVAVGLFLAVGVLGTGLLFSSALVGGPASVAGAAPPAPPIPPDPPEKPKKPAKPEPPNRDERDARLREAEAALERAVARLEHLEVELEASRVLAEMEVLTQEDKLQRLERQRTADRERRSARLQRLQETIAHAEAELTKLRSMVQGRNPNGEAAIVRRLDELRKQLSDEEATAEKAEDKLSEPILDLRIKLVKIKEAQRQRERKAARARSEAEENLAAARERVRRMREGQPAPKPQPQNTGELERKVDELLREVGELRRDVRRLREAGK